MSDSNTYFQGWSLNLPDPDIYQYHFYAMSDSDVPVLNVHFPLVLVGIKAGTTN